MIREQFDRQLASLREELLRMGSLGAEAVSLAVEGLKRRDAHLLDQVVEREKEVDRRCLQLERRCVELLATQQPMAGDLRAIVAGMVINIDLERFTDHAEGIAIAARFMIKEPPLKPLVDIPRMTETVQDMLDKALESFVNSDVDLARRVCDMDDQVDDLRHQIMRELLTYMLEDPRNISRAMDLVRVAQHLERCGDHVTNVAERVIYVVTGELKDLNE